MLSGYGEHMMGYVSRLAARSLNKVEVVRPRTLSTFEPQRAEGVFISGPGIIDEVSSEGPMSDAKEEDSSIPPIRHSLRRRRESPQDLAAETSEDEYKSIETSPDRSFSQTPQRAEGVFISGPGIIDEVGREGPMSDAKEEDSSIPPIRHSLRKRRDSPQDLAAETSEDEYESIEISPDRSFSHNRTHLSVPEAIQEVVPQVKTGSIIEENAQSRHVLHLLASKHPVNDERNDLIIPNVEPGMKRKSAMFRTTGIQSNKNDPLGMQTFARRSSSPESDPIIHVTIGRIEVKASQKPSLQEMTGARNILSLEDYLRRPRGRG